MDSEATDAPSSTERSTSTKEMESYEINSHLRKKYNELVQEFQNLREFEENNPQMNGADYMKQLWQNKMKFISALTEKMNSLNPQELKKFPPHAKLDGFGRLRKHVENTKAFLDVASNQLKADEIELQSLEDEIKKLELMTETRKATSEINEVNSLTEVKRKLDIVFNEHRAELADILDELFPDDHPGHIKDILSDVSMAYFDIESGNPYISLKEDEYDYQCLNMLIEIGIITRHPHDKKKIRLANFIQ